MIILERVTHITKPPEEPLYSPHGYVIAEDGTTYSLLYPWWHGAVLALLYPDHAREAGYKMPNEVDELNVYEFQRFELDNHNLFPVVRICSSRILSPCTLDRGGKPVTEAQTEAVRLVFKALGMGARDPVTTDHKDMRVSDVWAFLRDDTDVYGLGKREVRQTSLVCKDDIDKDLDLE